MCRSGTQNSLRCGAVQAAAQAHTNTHKSLLSVGSRCESIPCVCVCVCVSMASQVLQDSLCGSSKVLLVCNISPEANSAGETLSSLNFASRAAQVELGQARRAVVERAAQPAASERHKDGALTPQQSHGTAAGPPAHSPERGTAGPRSSGASARSGVRASQVAAKIATTPQGKDKEARDSHHATPT